MGVGRKAAATRYPSPFLNQLLAFAPAGLPQEMSEIGRGRDSVTRLLPAVPATGLRGTPAKVSHKVRSEGVEQVARCHDGGVPGKGKREPGVRDSVSTGCPDLS